MFFETSQDILYIIMSFAILWFTVFICWVLWQAARFLRNANKIVETTVDKLELIADAVEFIRGKVDHMSGRVGTVGKVASLLADKMVLGKLAEKFEEKLEVFSEKKPARAKRKVTRRTTAKKKAAPKKAAKKKTTRRAKKK